MENLANGMLGIPARNGAECSMVPEALFCQLFTQLDPAWFELCASGAG